MRARGPWVFSVISPCFAMLALASSSRAATCEERLSDGDAKPLVSVALDPPKALAGHRVDLVVTVTHLAGETVLPREVSAAEASEATALLRSHGLGLVESDGHLASSSVKDAAPGQRETQLRFQLVPLPEKPGPQTFEVPALPITVGRPSGRTATVCTTPLTLAVDSPTASTPHAEAKPNASALPQLEPFTALRWALVTLAVAMLLAPLLLWLWRAWKRRVKVAPEPPPPMPPWVVAHGSLDMLITSGLVESARFDEFFDRLSDLVRRYLGDRFGFDGLESTSDEVVRALLRNREARPFLDAARAILEEADLAKFARSGSDASRCGLVIDRARNLVAMSTPAPRPASSPLAERAPRASRGVR